MKKILNFILILCFSFYAYSEIPSIMNYQGILKDNSNKPLNGVKIIHFSLYDCETCKNSIWNETQQVVFNNGYFNVYLNVINQTEIIFKKGLWLGIKISDDQEELKPRIILSSVPYSFRASVAESIEKDVAVTSINEFKNSVKIIGKGTIDIQNEDNNIIINNIISKNNNNFFFAAGIIDKNGNVVNRTDNISINFDGSKFEITNLINDFNDKEFIVQITPTNNDGFVNGWEGSSNPDLMLNLSKNPMNFTIEFNKGKLLIYWRYKDEKSTNNYWNIPFQFVIYKIDKIDNK